MATPLHNNPCPGGHEIYNLVDPSLVIITIYLVCLFYAWEFVWTMQWSREEKNLVKIGQVVLEKMLMQEAQQTTDNNGLNP